MDDISSFIVEQFYKNDRSLLNNKRVSAFVGACYFLNLKRLHPEVFSEQDSKLLDSLLEELDLNEAKAAELLEEINQGWQDSESGPD